MLGRNRLATVSAVFALASVVAGCSRNDAGAGSPGSTSSLGSSRGPGTAAVDTSTAAGRHVRLGDGREIYLACRGSGSPTVVLESGYHDSSDLWGVTDAASPVKNVDAFSQIAAFTRVRTRRYP